MSGIDGSRPESPKEPPQQLTRHTRELYEQEYKHGVDLFQRALTEYAKADEPHKKEAFLDVMDRAMQVLNETARGLKRQDLLEHNQKIQSDLQAYQDSEKTPEQTKLAADLEKARKYIG